MSDNTEISWADATWPITTGCDPVSPGCWGCYAEKDSWRLAHNPNPKVATAYEGVTAKGGDGRPHWTGRVNVLPERLDWPLRWKKPRKIFVANMSDLFHDDVPTEFLDEVFAVIALCDGTRSSGRRHIFQVLTKRPARMRAYIADPDTPYRVAAAVTKRVVGFRPHRGGIDWRPEDTWPLPNVWAGTSVEDQKRADLRVPKLLQTPAAVRFLSCEPLLGPVDVTRYLHDSICDAPGGDVCTCSEPREVAVDWIIVGGESGYTREVDGVELPRPMHPDWARSLRDQAVAAGVAFHFKQWGEWVPDDRDGWADVHLKGRQESEWWAPGPWCFLQPNGQRSPGPSMPPSQGMRRVGKKAAGRALDGRTWDEFPTVRPVGAGV